MLNYQNEMLMQQHLIASRAKKDNTVVKTIAVLTALFLPGTFIAVYLPFPYSSYHLPLTSYPLLLFPSPSQPFHFHPVEKIQFRGTDAKAKKTVFSVPVFTWNEPSPFGRHFMIYWYFTVPITTVLVVGFSVWFAKMWWDDRRAEREVRGDGDGGC